MNTINKLYVHVDGIYCEHCIETIKLALCSLDGVESTGLHHNVAEISGKCLPPVDLIVDTIREIGYATDKSKISTNRSKVSRTVRWYEFLLIAAAIITVAVGIRLIFGYNIFNAIPTVDSRLSYAMLFVTGLLTSIHCISMCGAIGIFALSESNSVRSFTRPLLYNAGRVISYTVIGGIVGLVGSTFSINATIRGVVILVAAVFMLLMALSMMGVIFFHLPRFFTVQTSGKRLGAFVIGLLNGLMPCGPLQTMQIYALSTGSVWRGAVSMALFALGTVPLMLLSGAALNLSKGKGKRIIGKVAAVLMVILSVSMLNRGLLCFGIDVTSVAASRYDGYIAATVEDAIQRVDFDLSFDSYADIVVQKGIPVKMTVHADEGTITGCNNEIISRDFGFDVPLSAGDNVIEFTPTEEGDFVYTCWMNMISNHIRVIDDIDYFE